ncbi:helix-turn-helix domain-containing protein [Saccharothrix variisporea]|uniref:Helix-turn-helix protein n=1 Tax=Saccharothrix variisporea TaxID=543527 RepID=A0A495X089_9PSEU|nr:helix-turn-helix transcriptional regulator [Saccharothrix variisporea]RKT67079.1 helix-turn-helix protein [Saccharothrix variisporea]
MTTDDVHNVAPTDTPSPQDEGWDWADDGSVVVADGATEKPYYQDLGRVIEQARSRRGWTAQQTAKRAGISYKTYLRIEHGEPVRNATLMKLDALFGLKPGTALDAWQRNDDRELEAALTPHPVNPGVGITDEELAKLIASLPKPSDMSPSARMLLLKHALDAVIDVADPLHRQRTVYEILVVLVNLLASDNLSAAEHMLSVAKEVRQWESRVGMPPFALSFQPDPAKYAKVIDPWSEYQYGEFEVRVSAGKLSDLTADEAQEVVRKMREDEQDAGKDARE